MSNTYSIACRDCKTHLWIAQRSNTEGRLYSTRENLKSLYNFLHSHKGHHLLYDNNVDDLEGYIEIESADYPPDNEDLIQSIQCNPTYHILTYSNTLHDYEPILETFQNPREYLPNHPLICEKAYVQNIRDKSLHYVWDNTRGIRVSYDYLKNHLDPLDRCLHTEHLLSLYHIIPNE